METRTEAVDELLNLKEKLINKILEAKKIEKEEIERNSQELSRIIDNEVQNIQEKYLTEFSKLFPGNCNNLTDVAGLRQEYPDKMNTLILKGAVVIADDFDQHGNPDYELQITIDKGAFDTFVIDGATYNSAVNQFFDSEYVTEQQYTISSEKEKFQEEMNILKTAAFYELVKKYPDEITKIEDENRTLIETEKSIYEYIKTGAITENYANSISYFREGILSKNDVLFINYVKNKVGNSVDLELTYFDQIINELTEKDGYNSILLNEQILNYSLFNYLCLNRAKNNNSRILSDILSYIFKQDEESFIIKCIKEYSDSKNDILLAIFLLNESHFYPLLEKNYNILAQIEIFKNILAHDLGYRIYHINDTRIIEFVKSNKESLLNEDTKKNINILLRNE